MKEWQVCEVDWEKVNSTDEEIYLTQPERRKVKRKYTYASHIGDYAVLKLKKSNVEEIGG